LERRADALFDHTGTRFRIYALPKRLKQTGQPEVIYVRAAPGTIRAGPEDERIQVVMAEGKEPYRED
jgi:hypothetical protein